MKLGKNVNRIIAGVSSLAMVLSCAPAAMAANSAGSASGSGTVEYNDSTAPSYDKVVLPTMDDATYNFALDPTKLLHKYNAEQYTDADATVLFNTETTPATLTAIQDAEIDGTATNKKLYKMEKDDSATVADIKAALTVDAEAINAITSKFYLWVPDTSNEIATSGKYLELTKDNINDYFTVTLDSEKTAVDSVAMKTDHLAGSVVCSDKIYKDKYTEITGTINATDYVTLKADGAAIDTTTESANKDINLYVTTDSTAYTQLTKTNIGTYVNFTKAVRAYKGQTDKCTIVNKSTKKKVVTAKVTVNNPTGLTFKSTESFEGATDASVYLAITDGTTPVAVAEDASKAVTATKIFELGPADESEAITYQLAGTNDKTGGHKYSRFSVPDVTYKEKSFYVTASANDEAGAADAWATYNEALSALETAAIPGLDVVYSIADVEEYNLTSASANEAAATFKVGGSEVTKAAKDAVVTIIPGTVSNKIVDAVTYTPSGDSPVTVNAVDGAYTFTMPAKAVTVAVTYKASKVTAYASFNQAGDTFWVNTVGDMEATGTITDSAKLTSVKVSDKDGTLTNVNYTLSQNWISIKWNDMKTAGCTGTATQWTVEFVYDGTTYTYTTE